MKLLLLDIETAPNIAHVWGLWQQNVGLNQLLSSGYVMCWAAKWHGQPEVFFDSIRESKPRKMLKRIHALLDEADAVIHFYGTKFDIPTLNGEFLTHEFTPPAPYKEVDLCLVSKRRFKFPSNKLEYLAKRLGCTPKVTKRRFHGHELWVQCMADNPEAWDEMKTYNMGDVITLEEVYDKMLPWIPNHPNHGIYDEPGIPVCTNCGSGKLIRRGFARTTVNTYARYQCKSCGTWVRGSDSEMPKEDRAVVTRRVS